MSSAISQRAVGMRSRSPSSTSEPRATSFAIAGGYIYSPSSSTYGATNWAEWIPGGKDGTWVDHFELFPDRHPPIKDMGVLGLYPGALGYGYYEDGGVGLFFVRDGKARQTGGPLTLSALRGIPVWTGSKFAVWGWGDGALYDEKTDTWTHLTPNDAGSDLQGQSLVWTGKELIVFGGSGWMVNGTHTAFGGRAMKLLP